MNGLAEARARYTLDRAVLTSILAREFADESDPHGDAAAEHSDEQVALAARDLVDAVGHLPPNQQPIGWDSRVMAGGELAAAILHYAEGTIAPVAFWPHGCGTCARGVELYDRVVATYLTVGAVDTGG